MIRTLSAIAFLLSTLLVPAQAATVVRGQNEKLSTSPLTGCYNKKASYVLRHMMARVVQSSSKTP